MIDITFLLAFFGLGPFQFVYGLITLALALFTMGYQSILAAKTNPVEALKSE